MSDQVDDLLLDVPPDEGDAEWQQFPPESGSLGVPRASMPQIESEHRGAMVQFLKGRGITHTQEEVAPSTLKPSQAEYSPEKVERARAFDGPDRSLLVSSDDHVLDGHHQWLAAMADAPDEPYPVIRFHAPAQQLLIEAARFPSSGVDEAIEGSAPSDAAGQDGAQDELDGLLREMPAAKPQKPAPAPPRASAPRPGAQSVDPLLSRQVDDIINEVRSQGYDVRRGDGLRTPEQQAEKVKRGYSNTYDSKHLSGRAVDINAFDSQGNYISDASDPAYAAIVAAVRRRAPLLKSGGDFRGFYDPSHVELAGDALDEALLDVPSNLGAQPQAAAQPKDELDSLLDTLPAEDDGDVVRTEATVDRGTGQPLALSDARRQVAVDASTAQTPDAQPAPLPQRPFDLQTTEGRQARDARKALERTPGASLEVSVPLPQDLNTPGGDLVRDAYRRAAASRGVPGEFFDEWAKANAPSGYSLRDARGNQLTVPDAMTPDAYDEKNHSVRVRLDPNHLAQIVDAYKLAQLKAAGIPGMEDVKSLDEVSPGLRALTVDSDETSPGEKLLSVVGPPAAAAVGGAARGLDLATRPLQAMDAGFWAKVRGANDLQAVKAAYDQFFGDNPELGKNVIAEALRNSDRLKAINPRLPALLGELANVVVEPSNLIPVGAVAKGARLLRGAEGAAELGRVGRLVEGAGDAAREAGLLDRGLVEVRPLGIEDAKPMLKVARDGITGVGYEMDPATRLIYERGRPTGYALDEGGSVVKASDPAIGNQQSAISGQTPVPDTAETLPEQMSALRARRRPVVEVPPDAMADPEIKTAPPLGMRSFKTFDGGRVIYNPELVTRDEVVKAWDAGRLEELNTPVAPQAANGNGAASVEADIAEPEAPAPTEDERPAEPFPLDESRFARSPYSGLDPQEVLSAAVEDQRARLSHLARFEDAAARSVDPVTGRDLSPRQLKKLQTRVADARAEAEQYPALVKESFGPAAAAEFTRRSAEGMPTSFNYDPRVSERGAVNVSEIASGLRSQFGTRQGLLDLAKRPAHAQGVDGPERAAPAGRGLHAHGAARGPQSMGGAAARLRQ